MFHSRITEPKIVGHLSDSVSIEDETEEVWCHCLNLDLRESGSRILPIEVVCWQRLEIQPHYETENTLLRH